MKRRAIQVVVLLLLGAIANVAVAWGFATRVDVESGQRRWTHQHDQLTFASVLRNDAFGSTRVRIYRVPIVDAPRSMIMDSGYVQSLAELLPDWTSDDSKLPRYGLIDARGWPMRSLLLADVSYAIAVDDTFIGDLMGLESPQRTDYRLRWPTRPIWPGFAINTIFYAAILWVLFAVPLALRRRRRTQRGLCPACAYPIGSSPVCTECGNPLKVRTGMGLPPPATPATDTERTT